jgi:hypothetical protein
VNDSPSRPVDRRTFLQAAALGGTALALPKPACGAPGAPAPAPATPAGAPHRLAWHRHLFNGDCNFLFYNPELWQPEGGRSSVRAIERYLGTIAAGGIDTLLVNPNTQVAWYPSKRLPHILAGYTRGDLAHTRRNAAALGHMTPELAETYARNMVEMLDLYLDLAESGVDWLAECARISRALGMSPWLSYRMNPTHFSSAPDAPVNAPVFRDPANRLSGRVPDARGNVHAAWVGLNYARPAVRDHMLAMIREGVEQYDYEGLELDWFRHPVCLEWPASERDIAVMTDWFAGLRELTLRRRPDYRLTVRAPSNLRYLRGIGLDLKELARRGLIDGVAFSNFWQTPWEMPLDELRRELGGDIAVYGGMEDAPNWLETLAPSLTKRPSGPDVQLAGDNAYHTRARTDGPARVRGTRYLTASPEFLRANAAGKLVLGADGLEQFNFFVTDQVRVPGLRADYTALRGLDRLETLRGQPKHYAFNTASLQGSKLWDVPEQLPVRIAPRHRRALRLPMVAEPADAGLRLVVQVVTERDSPVDGCGVSVNGGVPTFAGEPTDRLLFPAGPYSHHVEEHRARDFALDVAVLRDGWNEVTLYNEADAEVSVVAVELGIMRPSAPPAGT